MTDRDLEQRLRRQLLQAIDAAASPALRASVLAIPNTVPSRRRSFGGPWLLPPVNRFVPLAMVAAAAVAAAVVGISVLTRLESVGPPTTPTPEPTSTPLSRPTPSAVASPTQYVWPTMPATPRTLPPSDEITPPDPIHNAELLPFACAYPFDEIIEAEFGAGPLRRTKFSLVGYGTDTSCGLRHANRNVAVVHVYWPLTGATLRERVSDLMAEPGMQLQYHGTQLFFDEPDSSGFANDGYVLFVAHDEYAVLVNLDVGVWRDPVSQLNWIARQIVDAIDLRER